MPQKHNKKKAMTYKKQIKQDFSKIRNIYEISNSIMSVGTDNVSRNIMAKIIKKQNPKTILELGIGPGTLTKKVIAKHNPTLYVGLDLSLEMTEKVRNINNISIVLGIAEKLPFRKTTFNVVTSSFFTRHYTDYIGGYLERYRVLTKKGATIDIELGKINNHPLYFFHRIYFTRIIHLLTLPLTLPLKLIKEYELLPQSYSQSPPSQTYELILSKTGFKFTKTFSLFLGFYMIICGIKL